MGMDSSPGGQTERPVSSRFTVGRSSALHVDMLNPPNTLGASGQQAQQRNHLARPLLPRPDNCPIFPWKRDLHPRGLAAALLAPPSWQTAQWFDIASSKDLDTAVRHGLQALGSWRAWFLTPAPDDLFSGLGQGYAPMCLVALQFFVRPSLGVDG
ncbi:unnamed protein product, partial [Clonostachys rosea f. rosea IK726]|jgi:hypothetical protein